MSTKIIAINPEFPETNKVSEAAKIIRQGGLVIFPTETVYGIAADYSNPQALKKLYEVKNRPEDKPVSILICQKGLISNYTTSRDTAIFKLADKFWPGPLTIVVSVREGDGTVGVRMPDHEIALKLVQESQCTIAAPSANLEGEEPPKTCAEALKDLDGKVEMAIDGGEAKVGQSSTVVDMSDYEPKILRKGAITQEEIEKVANTKNILFVCTGNSCRSVMAEYMLKDYLKGRDDVEVFSAGTGVNVASMASADTLAVLTDEGVDAQGHQSQSINAVLLKKSDIIFVMTQRHRRQVLERVPEVEKRIYLLREFVNSSSSLNSELDIPDPMGRPHQAYRDCVILIKEALHKVIELI